MQKVFVYIDVYGEQICRVLVGEADNRQSFTNIIAQQLKQFQNDKPVVLTFTCGTMRHRVELDKVSW